MTTKNNFSNQFLIGLPGLQGDYFRNTLSLLIDHSEEGSFGLVINRPLDVELDKLFPEFDLSNISCAVVDGGPVQGDKAFFLHESEYNYASTLDVSDQIQLTTSTDLLEDLASGNGPTKLLIVLGYAGWGAGQLEHELSENVWLLVPGNDTIVFDTPFDQRAKVAAKTIGVDINLISPTPGHG